MAGIFTAGFRSVKLAGVTLVLIFYASTMFLFFTSTRFRLPLLVILIPFAVIGIQKAYTYIVNRDLFKIVRHFLILILFFIVESLPVQATGDMSAYYNTHATALNSKGLEDDAIKYWEISSGLEEFLSDFANLSLAEKYCNRGDIIKGTYYLDKITDDSYAATYKYELSGDITSSQGDIDGAISAYEKSLDINSGRREVRKKLIQLYWKKDRQRALREYDTLEYISSFYNTFKTE
jgi:tetratricopeptide (TPR) repeat protein